MASNSTLGIKVEVLEGDVRDIREAVGALDQKVEHGLAALGLEVRTALASIADKFNDRQKTPWMVLIGGAGLIVSVMGIFGHQALDPIYTDIKDLKQQIVPRAEHEARWRSSDKNVERIEINLLDLQKTRAEQQQRMIDRLEAEVRALRSTPK